MPTSTHLPGLDLAGGELVEFDILEMSVDFALLVEVAVGTLAFEAAVMEHENSVALADRGKPVWQEDHGPAVGEPLDRVIDEGLDLVVEPMVRLLDNQDRGVVEVSPGQCDPKFLVRR